jgi:hypothetical protein
MSESPLSTHAGPIATTAGTLFALIHVGQFIATARSDLCCPIGYGSPMSGSSHGFQVWRRHH